MNVEPYTALGVEYRCKSDASKALGIKNRSLDERQQYRPWEYYPTAVGPTYYPISAEGKIFQTIDECAEYFNTTKSGVGVRISRRADWFYTEGAPGAKFKNKK